MDIIKIENLSKTYKNIKAVDDLSFKVKKGELFAFLGQNGAGKSTTINIICSRIKRDAGTVEIDGEILDDKSFGIKKKLGVVFQSSVLDKQLTARENLKNRASLYSLTKEEFEKRLLELSKLFDLESFLDRPIGKLSGGQRRKVDIVRALIHKPKILILDEPTTGLDPMSRKTLWDVINNLRKTEEMTVFLTTHYMEEAVDADYIVILDKGKICAEGSPVELKNRFAKDYVYIYGIDENQIKSLNKEYQTIAGGYKIEIDTSSDVTKLILENVDIFKDYEVIKGKMDDVFLSVTGKNFSAEEKL
ncbi:MAG: ABC transporter ATP-binding protein [Clostridiales bacterium]|nr:ABC transporter ATP-binding protein [Clostridiales bacterium]